MVRQAAEALRQSSEIEPFTDYKLSQFRRGLRSLGPDAVNLLSRPLSEIDASEVLPMLQMIEKDLTTREDITRERAVAFAIAIRQFLCWAPDVLKSGQHFRDVVAMQLPALRRRPALRRNDIPPVVGHLPHVDWEDLRRQAQRQLELRYQAIEQAIGAELELYDRVAQQQADLLVMPIPAPMRAEMDAWLCLSLTERKYRSFPSVTAAELAAIMLQHQEAFPVAWNATGWPQSDWKVTPYRLQENEGVEVYRFRYDLTPWLWARYRLPNILLTSIFLALLIHTGWNQGSVGALTMDDLVLQPQGGFRLQGYKGKTDDHTPVVDVSPSQRVVYRAIELLLWNHQQLKAMGLLASTERRLWFGWQKDGFANTINVIDEKRVVSWCQRHGIDSFSPSALRPLKAALTYLPQRDLEAVRVLLGHNDLCVTDGYLQDTLFFRLNEANMLQFQRRIETSLVYAEGGSPLISARGLDHRDVDASLLMPTGDGGACADIFAGPSRKPLASGEPCAGLLCQQGGGCPQYRLVVTAQTLEMALRTRRYYRSRWSVLASAQPEAFLRLHVPRLLYIHVLLRIVHTQRPDLLRCAEEAMA
ncbi:hypothetical protein Y882_07490 [Dyella japonica DSM 16301]|uniref:Uncharacterized protein n=2 Tax=Dyella japonica TaxID=231455 RepID=A0A0G9H3H7_9GAMM|nr:hypothetical protein Y882_07490 [Dyella japonica DSM 16301]